MQNQRLPKIAMAKTAIKRSRFNFSHDVNTTADFGVVQPSTCKYIVGNSKTTLNTESLTRLAPMIAPTFGRMKLKHWHYFVECSDVCKQFKSLLAREPMYSQVLKSTYVPNLLPSCRLSALSSLVFVGSRCTFYKRTNLNNSLYDYEYDVFKNNVTADQTELQNLLSWKSASDSSVFGCPVLDDTTDSFTSVSGSHFVLSLSPYGPSSGYRTGIGSFSRASSFTNALIAPLANTYGLISGVNYADLGHIYDTNGNLINHPVTLEGADYIYNIDLKDSSNNTHSYTIAFKFSDAGKRWRKIMIGLGYQVDISNTSQVNILPFLGYYRAYWSLFQLPQWKAWEETNCYKLMDVLNASTPRINEMTDSANYSGRDLFDYFVGFYKDCVDCYVTDSADFVSSHIPSTAISPKVDLEFIDVTSNDAVVDVDSSSPNFGTNGHSYINLLQHGHLDEEYLKRIYKWTNRNSIIGRRVAELLRAQGLGDFVDTTKSSFVGYTEDVINISDVVSQADTSFAGAGGAQLGQFGGKGVQYTKGKNFVYENDEPGFFITLSAIVPESGYSQAIDSCHYAIQKESLYNPDFDSLGYDMSKKTIITGARDTNDGFGLDSAFGFKPRYFEYKFKNNVCNGDFTLRSTRDVYLPYFLDKFIPVGDYHFATNSTNGKLMAKMLFGANQIPTAGNWWRFVTKYPWLGNLKRIFADYGHVDDNGEFIPFVYDYDLVYWTTSNHDDFLIHSIFDLQCYAPMLAVEDSFETTDDDEKPNMSVGKA